MEYSDTYSNNIDPEWIKHVLLYSSKPLVILIQFYSLD